MSGRWKWAAALLLWAAALGLAYDRSRAPLGWSGLLLALPICVHGVRARASARGKAAWLLGCCIGAFGVVEVGLWWRSPPEVTLNVPDIYLEDEVIGRRLRPGVEARQWKRAGDEVIFDVLYTIDELGRRVVGERAQAEPEVGVHLFGCSFLFGYGLNDAETLGWQLQAELGAEHRVHDWALPGCGVHNAVARVESGELEDAARAPRAVGVYWAIGDHAVRALGTRAWDGRGPRFELGPDGEPRRTGDLEPRPSARKGGLEKRSWIARTLAGRGEGVRYDGAADAGDVELWAALTARLAASFRARFDGAEFLVMLEAAPADEERMGRALDERGVPWISVAEVLGPGRWRLHPRDGHPNAAAHARLAAEVAGWVRAAAPEAAPR